MSFFRTKRFPNPKFVNIFLDSNALDDCLQCQNQCIERIHELQDAELHFMLPRLVAAEINHPNTPIVVKKRAADFICTVETARNSHELANAKKLIDTFQGNASDNRHDNDADHIFEAIKYGGGYFITEDKRIHEKSKSINGLHAVSRHEFLRIHKSYEI